MVARNYTFQLSKECGDLQACTMKERTVIFINLVMLLQKGSPLLDRVNIITRVSEGSIFNQWVKNCPEMREINRSEANAATTLEDEFCDLNMKQMQSAFYILLFGQGLGFSSFLMELLYSKCILDGHF
jgi:hypothetical protein